MFHYFTLVLFLDIETHLSTSFSLFVCPVLLRYVLVFYLNDLLYDLYQWFAAWRHTLSQTLFFIELLEMKISWLIWSTCGFEIWGG